MADNPRPTKTPLRPHEVNKLRSLPYSWRKEHAQNLQGKYEGLLLRLRQVAPNVAPEWWRSEATYLLDSIDELRAIVNDEQTYHRY